MRTALGAIVAVLLSHTAPALALDSHEEATESNPEPAEAGDGETAEDRPEAADDFVGSATPTNTTDPEDDVPPTLGEWAESNTLGAEEGAGSDDPSQETIVVQAINEAARDNVLIVGDDRPCAVEGSGGSGGDEAFTAEDAEALASDTSLDANQELLDWINGLGSAAAASFDRSGKVAKSPASQGSSKLARFLLDEQVDVDAVFEILREQAAEASSGIPVPGETDDDGCQVFYFCGGERVDDIINGTIDSEPPAAYAEYVAETAHVLDVLTANIRAVESEPPLLSNGEPAPVIPVPSSQEGIASLTEVLADRGLGAAPEGLFVPVFNYCRIGDGGLIEIDRDAKVVVARPTFTWSRLVDEFDIDGSSDRIVDELNERLSGRLPEMATIPPVETGVTVVQFPMWLWLEDPFVGDEIDAVSPGRTVRVRGRATLKHVTWTLGDNEIVCELEDMVPFIADSEMSPIEDIPVCHHIFTDLVEYTMTAAAMYVIEEDVARLDAPGLSWPPANWRTHPRTPEVTIQSTTPPMQVCAVGVVNVAFDADVSELEPLCAG